MPTAEQLEAYLDLKPEDVARLVLLLLLEERLRGHLGAFVSPPQQLAAEPAQG
jgi:hypothetical protein